MGDYSLPTERVAAVAVPTLVLDGGASFPWIRKTAQAIADVIPDAQHRTLEGQTHNVAAEAIAPVLEKFFVGGCKSRESVSGKDR
jgi:pimeloyl-ACP methyl ester carboxylesterase